jgi:predicted nucleic acid-binding protein
MNFVLDASIALTWCFADEATPPTLSLLDKLQTGQAFVPCIWSLELGNILISAERRKRITYAEIVKFIELITNLNIQTDSETSDRALHEILSLAYAEQLTTYDASYLELAMRKGLALATKDSQLAKVAKRLGIELLP